MNSYYFTMKGIATKEITIEADNADEAFAYLNDMIGRTSIADFSADEINEMEVCLVSAINEDGELINETDTELELDDEGSDRIYVCPHCKKKGD